MGWGGGGGEFIKKRATTGSGSGGSNISLCPHSTDILELYGYYPFRMTETGDKLMLSFLIG